MPTPDMEAITQFAQAGMSDQQLLNESCRTLAERYIQMFDSLLPWTDAVYKAQPRYPGLSQGQIAQRWVLLDDARTLSVAVDKNHNLVIRELS
ncbi:hypothetical protein [Pseudomonas viridiflava]|uniref:hypothetical protein n=1 Tax=Pseudomonas viridiflava TaxID=33069 RepID=UPI000F02A474|nr:hypothetical protein [Pseudomonas viridiflava]